MTRPTILIIALMLLAAPASAQGPRSPIYQEVPFDLLQVKGHNEPFKCFPLELPNRYKITIPKTGNLKLKLFDPADPNDIGELMIPWRLVERIDVFERMVLAEAQQLMGNQADDARYDKAFPYFEFLLASYPNTPGLTQALHQYLYDSAIHLFTRRPPRLSEALSSLEELARRNPSFALSETRTVAAAISAVADRLIQQYVDQGDTDSARTILRRLIRQYGSTRLPVTNKWVTDFNRRATIKRDQLQAQLRAGQYRQAYDTSLEMLRIWPDVEGGRDLAREASRRYPIVRVAVTERANSFEPRRIDDWGARRLSRLHHRLLIEYVEPGPSGGQYVSPFGTLEHSDDLSAVYFQLRKPDESEQQPYTAYHLARRLLTMADPNSSSYSASWAGLMAGVDVLDPYDLTIMLRRSNVLPEAQLQILLTDPDDPAGHSTGGYEVAQQDERETLLKRKPDYPERSATQPAEIVEVLYEHTSEAVNDLRAGRLDVIDRLFPAEAAQLRQLGSTRIQLGQYAEPTLYVLIPNLENPYLARSSFRRAVIYAIGRQEILDELLLEKQELPGAQVLNGPFSAESYAFDDTVQPMKYRPKLAFALTRLTYSELEQIAEQREEDPPAFKPLVLGHPATKVARMASRAIAAQLSAVQIECTVKEFPLGQVRDLDGSCDLVFAEVLMSEPIVDAERLLSQHGLAKCESPHVGMALRRLNRAQDWKEVASRLRDVHRAAMQDVSVIPLWQIPQYFAYRVGVRGINDDSLSLYQDVEGWQVEPLLLVQEQE